MLQTIRDRLHGIIAIFIFALLIIPFALVGVSSYFTSDAVNNVALVNDQEITINQFNQSFQNYRRRMQAQMGTAFDPEQFEQVIVRRQFLDQMINEELLAQVSTDSGLAVSDDRLAEAIRTLAAFEVDGEFNADVYQQRLAAQGMTPKQFEIDMRTGMVLDQFPTVLASSAISTAWELKEFTRLQDQQRAFRAIIVPALPAMEAEEGSEAESELTDTDQAADEATEAAVEDAATEATAETVVEEEALLAWYEAHQDEYLSEEQVVVEYLELDAEKLGGSVEPDEELLRARFEEQEARFVTPEARMASHILIEVAAEAPQVDMDTARQIAEELTARARGGEDFAELAKENSQDIGSAAEGGDLGWIEPGYMVQSFEDGLYELTLENPISEPIQTRFGWHVIYLRDIRPAEGMTFTEARDLLLEEYRAEVDERRFIEQADRLIDIIYEDPTTLDAAADELGLEVAEAGPFGRLGGEGVAANQEVVSAAFSDLVLAQGVVSDPVDLGLNHIVLIRLKEYMPQALKPFEDVREQVVESVTRQRAMDAAAARAESLLADLAEGAAIDVLAETAGLELVEAEAATRTSTDIDGQLRDQLFLLAPPGESGPARTVIELENGYAVVQLESVSDGLLSEDDALRKAGYSRRIANATASDETIGFLRMLRAQSTIEIYEDRL